MKDYLDDMQIIAKAVREQVNLPVATHHTCWYDPAGRRDSDNLRRGNRDDLKDLGNAEPRKGLLRKLLHFL